MTRVERKIPVAPDRVFEVLADGWSYAAWVVGSSHVRDVDPAWPGKGARLHHSSGPWPLTIRDVTVVEDVEPGRFVQLQARLWVLGRIRIRLTLTPAGAGETLVVLEETAVDGPARLLPHAVQKVLFEPRNSEALARLADLATGRGATLR